MQKYLQYTAIASSAATVDYFIDLARDLSAINRRLHRTGNHYHVKKITLISDDGPVVAEFSCAPKTWVTKNAYKRGFDKYNEMRAQILDQDGQRSLKARWSDFRPFLTLNHKAAVEETSQVNKMLTPFDAENENLLIGEWDYTTFESPDSTSSVDGYNLTLMGDHFGLPGSYNTVSLIQSYADSRGTVNQDEPNVPDATRAAEDPLVNLLDAGSAFDEIAENVITEGQGPPYVIDAYCGGADNMPHPLVFGELRQNEERSIDSIYGVDVPMGVMQMRLSSENLAVVTTILVELGCNKDGSIRMESMTQ